MAEHLIWGLIGASTIAREYVIPAMRAAGHEVAAVVSSSAERGDAFARANDIAASHDRLEAVLDDRRIDAVYISTTNELHERQTLAAARAGKHVLCEKPLALTVEAAAGMVQACRDEGVVLATNHHLRNAATHGALRRLVGNGAIGRPLAARVFHAVYLPQHLQGWRLHRREAGAGVVLDITVHDADTLRYVLGDEVERVVAVTAGQGMASPGIDDAVMGVMTFARGTLASFHDAFTVRHAGTGLEIHGTAGSLVARDVMTQRPIGDVELRRERGTEAVDVGEREDLYTVGLRRFARAVAGTGEPAATGEDGVSSLAIALAALQSARTGRAVSPTVAETVG